MRILIAYDGSDCANSALADLKRSALPAIAEVRILSVAEVTSPVRQTVALATTAGYGASMEEKNEQLIVNAKALADQAAERVRAEFPKWTVSSEVLADTPQVAIARRSESWQPDLIVMGSHGISGFKRWMLGSVSQHVLNHVRCSVHIGRCGPIDFDRPLRITVGTDGSQCSCDMLQHVLSRPWPRETKFRVISVANTGAWALTAVATLPQTMCVPVVQEELLSVAGNAVQETVRQLKAKQLDATPVILEGDPATVLVAQAEEWQSDCIFIGARGLGMVQRMVLGSVSGAVVSCARCSVEVVRSA